MRAIKLAIICGFALMLSVSFQNCGQPFEALQFESFASTEISSENPENTSEETEIAQVEIPTQPEPVPEPQPVAGDLFFDSFETGDFSAKTGVNIQGFSWEHSQKMSIVNSTHQSIAVNDEKGYVSEILTPKSSASFFPGDDWTAYRGEYSLRFAYGAGMDTSEQRFKLGKPMKDVWIRFWLRVPNNFSYGPKGSPNKLFSLWSDKYSRSGDGSTFWLSCHRINGEDSDVAFTYSNGRYTTSNAMKGNTPFISTKDRGRWMHLVLHFKTESSPGAGDGLIQTYRRWDDKDEYETLHERFNLPIVVPRDGKTNGFLRGYVLGWVNAAYTENTEWLMDDFAISADNPIK